MEKRDSQTSEKRDPSSMERKMTSIALGFAEAIERDAPLDKLTTWIQEAETDDEASRMEKLRTALEPFHNQDNNQVEFDQFLGLFGAMADNCGTLDAFYDKPSGYVLRNLYDIDKILKIHNQQGIDKVFDLVSARVSTPVRDTYLLTRFADAVVASDDRERFDWILEDFFNLEAPQLVPLVIQSFSDLLQTSPSNDTFERIREWAEISEVEPLNPSIEIEHLKTVKEHVRMIADLEKEEPGSTSYLIKEYNIYCFSRYPKQLLLDQYRNRNDFSSTPHGLLISSIHDWNESSRFGNTHEKYDRFYQQVKNAGYDMRVVEVATKSDLLSYPYIISSKYGKIDFGVITGHANKFHIRLGESETDIYTSRDLRDISSQILTDAFKKDATIVLSGCELGKIGGFAQRLSEKGFTVISSNSISSIKGLTFFPEETQAIDLTYQRGKHTNVYRNGHLVKDQGELIF